VRRGVKWCGVERRGEESSRGQSVYSPGAAPRHAYLRDSCCNSNAYVPTHGSLALAHPLSLSLSLSHTHTHTRPKLCTWRPSKCLRLRPSPRLAPVPPRVRTYTRLLACATRSSLTPSPPAPSPTGFVPRDDDGVAAPVTTGLLGRRRCPGRPNSILTRASATESFFLTCSARLRG
jgi:hypothetical protein